MKAKFSQISYFNTQHLVDLVNERNSFLDKYNNSVDENFKHTIEEPKEIDEIKNEIIEYIKENVDTLAVDIILEVLTHLGDEPSVLYNGEGLFCIGSLYETITPDLNGVDVEEWEEHCDKTECNIPNERWFPTIRESLNFYIKNY